MTDIDSENFERLVNSGKFVPTTVPTVEAVPSDIFTPKVKIESSESVGLSQPFPKTSQPAIEVQPIAKAELLHNDNPQGGNRYAGDFNDNEPVPTDGYQAMALKSPAHVLALFNPDIQNGTTTLWKWQAEVLVDLAPPEKPLAIKPLKYYLVAANGSGKDAFIIAPFAIWFCLSKVRSRVIITSSSGTQLTAQTETYIRNLAERVNQTLGQPIFKIRQRYIRCNTSGSEIRMFATDEAGKAEGYHPLEANAEMAIIKNESKSISDEIHKALKRCTGYNYWLEISSPGKPQGAFHQSVTDGRLRFAGRRITSFECPHISEEEREDDKITLGESSAEYRSKHLALFTFVDGESVISSLVYDKCLKNPPLFNFKGWPKRVGIDLAAGGDENQVCITQGTKLIREFYFADKDTIVTTNRIEQFLLSQGIDKRHDYIYADDGGVGHAIIDNLCSRGWKINRVLNQSPAWNKREYGNKGAECWFRVKRILEECLFDISGLSSKTREQLVSRKYKQPAGGKLYLQPKREAKAEGNDSPDRADGFVLSFTGLTVKDFLHGVEEVSTVHKPARGVTSEHVPAMYEEHTYKEYENNQQRRIGGVKVRGSLQVALNIGEDNISKFYEN